MTDIDILKTELSQTKNEILALKKQIQDLLVYQTNHTHSGVDGSRKLMSNVEGNFSYINTVAGAQKGNLINSSMNIYEAVTTSGEVRRSGSLGLAVAGRGTSTEQINTVLVSGTSKLVEQMKGIKDIQDFDTFSITQMNIQHLPNDGSNPPNSFIYGFRTPVIVNDTPYTGVLTNGASTLTDNQNKLDINGDMTGCIVNIYNASGFLESKTVASNTRTSITINGTWTSATGNYGYIILSPVYFGAADYPWRRLYTQTDIRFGIGPTSGPDVAKIIYHAANMNPNTNITANPGSIFLNGGGGAGATLWVKESGTQTNTGWIAK